MEKKLTCENCGEVQTHPVHWEQVYRGYIFSIEDMEWTGEQEEGGESSVPVNWACGSCGTDLTNEQNEILNKMI